MKRFMSLFQIMFFVAAVLFAATSPQARPDAESKVPELDTRIWSQSYWLKMAELGLVELAPEVTPKDAVYTSSRINAPGVATEDSPDVPVTNDPNTTQSENSIFVHPLDINTVLNSNNSTNWPVTILYGANRFFSNDGGQTWGGSVQGAGGTNSGDPAAAIGRNGWYYVGYIASGGQGVAHSTDGGETWTHVQASGGYGLDKNHLWIDNNLSSPYEGNLYSAWTNLGGTNYGEIELVRSTDSGLSWSPALTVSSAVNAGSHNQGVNIQTGPNGEVYVVWAVYDSWPSDETALGFAKSLDGGVSFEPATRIITNIRGIRTTKTSKNHRVNSFPVMSVDVTGGANHGTIYVVWTNIGYPGINDGPDIDVYLIKSTDGGSIWSTPAKVNQDPSGLGKEHYFPWITCDPAMGGLSVIFYDDRNVPSTDCEVFVASSTDGGATWIDFKVSDISFTPAPIPGLASGYFGDYLGISARAGKVYPCWTDNRQGSGRAMTYVSPFALEQDTIPPDPVTDLAVTVVGSNWAMLSWTASGDDSVSGQASSYDIRYSTSPIGEGNFDLATVVPDPPLPQEAGLAEVFEVIGLDFSTTYYFALKVRDEWGNASGVSNSPSGTTQGVPDIDISPDSLVDSVFTGDTSTQFLMIRNVGQDPSTLDFFFPENGGKAAPEYAFLSINPAEGSVAAGDSIDIAVTFDAAGLVGGNYYVDIEISSNDPDESVVIIPAHLCVFGAADIVLSDDTLDFGSLFVGASVSDTLVVSNQGTDVLTVSNIFTDNSDCTVDVTSFALAIGESQDVVVTFAPTTPGIISATLTIESDDPNEPSVTVTLLGEGLIAPDISTTPDSLDEELVTGETVNRTLTIHNEGGSDLFWDLDITRAKSSQKKLYVLTPPDPNPELPQEDGLHSLPQMVRTSPISAELADLSGVDILFDLSHGQLSTGGWSTIFADLTARGASVVAGSFPITLAVLEWYDILWITDLEDPLTESEITAIQDWLPGNKALVLEGDNDESVPVFNSLLSALGAGIEYSDVNGTGGTTGNIFPHETTTDVDSIYLVANIAHLSSVTAPASILVNDVAGVANTAVCEVGKGRIIAMAAELFQNVCMGVADNQLFANQVFDWLAEQEWLSATPLSGTIPALGSVDIDITFDATGMASGDFFAEIKITSNDPDESIFIVPAHMQVTGAPDIAVAPAALDFGSVYIGASVSDSLIVSNQGSGTLHVSNISSDNTDYSMDITSFNLASGENRDVGVIFAPTSEGVISGNLTIESDDPDEPAVVIALQGEGIQPPDISVSTDTLIESLFTGDTVIQLLTVSNTGLGNLVFAAELTDTSWLAIAPDSGVVPSGSFLDIQVTFDATGLPGGDYGATIEILSNDPDEATVPVVVHLHVCLNACGDIDGDGTGPNVADLTYLVDYLFAEGPPPPELETANVDGDNGVNVADITYLVEYLFFDGPGLVCEPIE